MSTIQRVYVACVLEIINLYKTTGGIVILIVELSCKSDIFAKYLLLISIKFTGHFRIPSIWYFCCQKVPFFHENLGFHLLNLSVSPTFFSEEERRRTLR